MPIKVDLHTHSVASHDGGITAKQYKQLLSSGAIDCVAITDHNRIDFAVKLQSKLGPDRVIVGEEISTQQGDIIGLFLNSEIKGGQSVTNAVADIKSQNGLVYIPHPFETVRKGVSIETLDKIKDTVDILETVNGRAFLQNYTEQAETWAKKAHVATASSSDSHSKSGTGLTYTELSNTPTAANLVKQLKTARHSYEKPSFLSLIAPKYNKLKKLFRK